MKPLPRIVEVNLSRAVGGAEIYTAFFTRALSTRGWPNLAVVHAGAAFWDDFDFGGAQRAAVRGEDEIVALVRPGDLVVVHAPLGKQALAAISAKAFLVGVAHAAIYDGTRPLYYDAADRMLAVSRFMIANLQAQGIGPVHPEPLLGVAEIDRRVHAGAVVRGPLCDWDSRKLRDRVLAQAAAVRARFARPEPYRRRPGLVLGIVSRLAPQKQFPALFRVLAPIIAARADVALEIFGPAVGYKALRELREATAPIAARTRFWGHQRDVAPLYPAFDYLVAGLPEREALGLNVIESCILGTPVLAVRAPPFDETVVDGGTGFLYTDPRQDGGRDFARVLDGIRSGLLRPDLPAMGAHLAQFSFSRFTERADAAMHAIARAAAAAGRSGTI